jgi:hypothetical protein
MKKPIGRYPKKNPTDQENILTPYVGVFDCYWQRKSKKLSGQTGHLGKPLRPRGLGGWLPRNQNLVVRVPSFTTETSLFPGNY